MMRLLLVSISFGLLNLFSGHSYASETSWLSFSGEVVAVNESSFVVDHGKGNVVANVKHWKWLGVDSAELRGQNVRVSGQMLDGAAKPTMKLLGIYLPKHHAYHFSDSNAAGALAAGSSIWKQNDTIWDEGNLLVVGVVDSVAEAKFVLNTGHRKVLVHTDKLLYDPLDDVGFQRITAGDQVMVSAAMHDDYFKRAKLEAGRVTSLLSDLD